MTADDRPSKSVSLFDSNQGDATNRKKLRVDRARKMTLGKAAMYTSVEDAGIPDWLKRNSLREIEAIRDAQKDDMVSKVIHNKVGSNGKLLNVEPGQASFITLPIKNF